MLFLEYETIVFGFHFVLFNFFPINLRKSQEMKKGKNPYIYFVYFQNRWQILNYFSVDSFHQEDKILISEEGYQ